MTRFFEGLVADVRLLGEDAEAAAGGVYQNSVRHGQVGVRPGAVGDPGLHVGKPHPLHGLADELDAVLADVAAHQPPFVPHLLDEEQALAAGGGAEVEDGIAGLCLHTEGGKLAGLPLHVEEAVPEKSALRRAPLEAGQDAARHKARGGGLRARGQQLFAEGFRRPFQGVGPEAGQAAVGGVGQDVQRLVGVVFVEERCHVPARRAQHHQPLHLVGEDGRAEVIADGPAQHGVHEAGGAGFFEGAGQLDGLIDRRRSRNLHIAGLRQRGAENFPHLRVELGKPFGQKLAQDIVQRPLMFQHGIKNRAGKCFIAAFQLLAAQLCVEDEVRETVLLLPHQRRHRRRAGVRAAHRLSPALRRRPAAKEVPSMGFLPSGTTCRS